MGEPIRLLKVLVLQGKHLAVRDFRTSDPYVIVKLGNQTAKTKVINSCLNPVWNEELNFSVTEPTGILRLEVYDKDRFKADDKMGHAYVDLRPLASAARLKQVLEASVGETKIRKVVPAKDNCLVKDSFVRYAEGEIVQDAWLRLCDVETGEIELKIKWIDLTSPASAATAKRV
ncbi:protein C2-DOMAIN ABA-RELATED 11 [Aristolochia californica]|uniref:protein C2-DOMAIN ABA-RELATED 11 n=1 Tax=Aristolochia californica TaxID=171875 RepID=UPI0035DD49F7